MSATLRVVAAAPFADGVTFDEIYDRHFDFVYRVLARLTVTGDAEDLAQEVFLVVHRRLPEFEHRANITTWLFRIAHRVARAHARKQRVRGAWMRAFAREAPPSEPPLGPQLVEHAQRSARAARAVRSLSWKKRTALLLHDVEGWTCALIAERLGVPEATVHTRLYHARIDLRRALRRERGRRP